MLILTRRIGESIKIGEQVEVAVLGLHGSQIRLGIKAPKEVAVHREEIFRRIQSNAAQNAKDSEKDTPTAGV